MIPGPENVGRSAGRGTEAEGRSGGYRGGGYRGGSQKNDSGPAVWLGVWGLSDWGSRIGKGVGGGCSVSRTSPRLGPASQMPDARVFPIIDRHRVYGDPAGQVGIPRRTALPSALGATDFRVFRVRLCLWLWSRLPLPLDLLRYR